MRFQQIRSFIAVFEEGSFSKAAQRENATQSGMSMQIQKLEIDLGVQLFDRTSKGISSTSAGKRLYARAVDILRDIKLAEAEAKASSESLDGKIVAGVLPAFSQSILAPTLVQFNEQYPNVEVSILEGFSPFLTEAVVRGDVDFAIIPIDAQRQGVRYQHFASDREVLVSNTSSKWKHLEPVSLRQLQGLELVLPTRGNARRDRVDLILSEYGCVPVSVLEVDSLTAAQELVANSEWTTILPAIICARDLESGRRKLHPISQPKIPIDYVVVENQTTVTSDGTNLFLQMLKDQFEKSRGLWTNAVPDF